MTQRANRATAPLSLAKQSLALIFSAFLSVRVAADEASGRPRSLTPSNVLSGYSGGTDIALSVKLRTANPCVDDATFVDDEGFFCVSQLGEDCSRFFIDWNTEMAWQDLIISHCPASCNVCSLPDRTIFSLTNADGSPVSFTSGVPDEAPSSFYGPILSDPPSTVVSLTLVVPFPGCYTSSFISDPLERYAPLVAYEVSVPLPDPDVVLIPFPPTGEWAFSPRGSTTFCLSTCALPQVYFPADDSCDYCPPGSVVDATTMSCRPCANSTYYEAPEDPANFALAAAVCRPCPQSRPFSHDGSLSVEDCIDLRFLSHLFAASPNLDAIVEYSSPLNQVGPSSFNAFVEEDDVLATPRAIAFLSPRILVVANYHDHNVVLYDAATAQFLGVLGKVLFPNGLVFLPESDDGPDHPVLLVSSYSNEDGIATVSVFDVSDIIDFDGVFRPAEPLTLELVVPVSFTEIDNYISVDRGFASMSVGPRPGEVILSNWLGVVVRFCVDPSLGCDASRSRILVQDLTGLRAKATDAGDIYGSRVFGQEQDFLSGAFSEYDAVRGRDRLIVLNDKGHGADGGVYDCGPVDEPPSGGSIAGKDICRLVSAATTSPGGAELLLDAELMLVSSGDGAAVLLLSLDNWAVVGKVGDKRGTLAAPGTIASRPGFYAPSSTFTTQGITQNDDGRNEIEAGNELKLALDLRAVGGKELPRSVVAAGRGNFDVSLLQIVAKLAVGEATEEATTVTVVGDVKIGSSGEVIASVILKQVGEWTIRILENSLNRMDFEGSPFNVKVVSKNTDPSACQYSGPSSIVFLNTQYPVSIELSDAYGNPTSHASDEVSIEWPGGTETLVGLSLGRAYFNITAKQVNVKQKVYPLHVAVNGEAIDGSPFYIMVYGNAPSVSKTIVIAIVVPIAILLVLVIARNLKQRRDLRIHINNEKVLATAVIDLQETLKATQHTAEELKVMREEIDSLTKERGDELRGVMIKSSDIKVLSMLGKGGFGVVNLALYDNTKVAVKQLLDISTDSVKRFRFECFLLKNLRHPNLVGLVGVVWDDYMLGCVLEFVENGSLEDHLVKDEKRSVDKKMTWRKELLRFAQEAALGIQYLHCTRYFDEASGTWRDCIVHRDLKPDNMLITNDWRLKLTDFGEARAVDLNLTMTQVGTPIYMAPEILRNDRYSHKVDSYSFGVVLSAMLRKNGNIINFFFSALQRDLKKPDMTGLGLNVLNYKMHEMNWRPHIPHSVYPSLRKLIAELWQSDPAKRPDFIEVVRRLGDEVAKEVSFLDEPEFDDELWSGSEDEGDQSIDRSLDMATQIVTQRLAVENVKILAELKSRGIVSDAIVAEITHDIEERGKKMKEQKKSMHKQKLSEIEERRKEKKDAKKQLRSADHVVGNGE